ncbi:Atlastin [Eufriesea mexicana]|uniref:Atlastin n=1 Tax=Eufriesea mexicana TaxID=516756 RepID=A0A310SFV0_9HYME|nr:Atlastin [Eufriesea mexicana]
MSERRKIPSGRKRHEQEQQASKSKEPLRPKEPIRPPRTRTQQARDNGAIDRREHRGAPCTSVETCLSSRPSAGLGLIVFETKKVPMTTLDENVNRVPRVYPSEREEREELVGWPERIERLSMNSQDNASDLGHPVQIVLAQPDHTFELNEEALEKILLEDDIKNRSVVVVSVAGAFRKGKSFLLDFFLRYMNSKYSNNNHTDSWLGKEDEPLSGFSWKGGSERDTTGILMWSKVFRGTLEDGEKVAVILMDTQGAFDSQSTVKDCATVFALSTMLSSVQIYNLSQNIQEDDLQHLQLFTEYGRLALQNSGSKPFQKLQFLIRDWSYPYEAKYGAEGGLEILNRRLEISDKQHPELQSLRKHIKSCFSDISCFLMPHPGLNIATNPHFDGRLSEIQPEFKEQLKVLISMLLAPENLVTKKINGQIVKARDLLEYFKSYMKIYKGNELPEPKSMLVATAEANNLAAVTEAREFYMRLMEDICGAKTPYLRTALLENEHARCMDKAMCIFQNKRKMGGDEFSQTYMKKLWQDMDKAFLQFKKQNEIFGFTGLYLLSNICNFVVCICMLTIMLLAYIRYSGSYDTIEIVIHEVANTLWNNLIKPVYRQFVEKSVSVAVAQAAEMATNTTMNATVTANGKPKLT